MASLKTQKLTININVDDEGEAVKVIRIKVNDADTTLKMPAKLMKTKITDSVFTKHILNFFIKD